MFLPRKLLSSVMAGITTAALTLSATAEQTIVDQGVETGKSVLVELYKFKANPTTLFQFLEAAKSKLDDQSVTFNSFVDMKDVEEVGKQIAAFDRILPKELDPLNSATAIHRIAGPSEGNLSGGAAQLDRLQTAEAERSREIQVLKQARDELATMAEDHKKTFELARDVTERVEKHVDDPAFAIAALVGGKNYPLSWLDLETELVPALSARADASKNALERFDAAIKIAENDLEGFREARHLADTLWNDPLASTAADQIQRLQHQMAKETETAIAAANQLRRQASSIRDHNAGIDAVQRLLTIGSKLATLGANAQKSEASGPADMSTSTSPNSVLLESNEKPHNDPDGQDIPLHRPN